MLLSMLTPLGMLERNPTLKSERERISNTSLSVGFYTYPVSQVADILLPKADLVPVGEDQLPMGQPITEWQYGDVDTRFEEAAVVLDESFVTAGLSHHCMEPRSCMAYWENGKCFLHGSSQSQTAMIPGLMRLLNIEQENLVYIAETCGGGFGSKGGPYPIMAVPVLLSRQTGRPVMLRITRFEEYGMGTARAGFQGRL